MWLMGVNMSTKWWIMWTIPHTWSIPHSRVLRISYLVPWLACFWSELIVVILVSQNPCCNAKYKTSIMLSFYTVIVPECVRLRHENVHHSQPIAALLERKAKLWLAERCAFSCQNRTRSGTLTVLTLPRLVLLLIFRPPIFLWIPFYAQGLAIQFILINNKRLSSWVPWCNG